MVETFGQSRKIYRVVAFVNMGAFNLVLQKRIAAKPKSLGFGGDVLYVIDFKFQSRKVFQRFTQRYELF